MAVSLEHFDTNLPSEPEDVGPSPDYLRGFADGALETQNRHDADQSLLRADILGTLTELNFGYAEARRHVLDSLAPLLTLVSQKVVPTCLQENAATFIAQYLSEIAAIDSMQPISVRVCPSLATQLTGLLKDEASLPISLVPDDSLTSTEAYWSTPTSESGLDLQILMSGIRDALDAIIDDNERSMKNG